METFKQLVHEIHRRSLWQVVGIFLAASWGVLQVVEVVTESVGLPDWTPGMAFVLLLLGFPVVVATAFVQEGVSGRESRSAPTEPEVQVNLAAGTGSLDRPSTRPSATKRLLTWRNAILGGVGAFALLGFSLVAYFVMWSSGIGPVGSLAAQGVFEEGEPVILAEFRNRSNDESLGGVVTEALRVDLASSQTITLVQPSRIREVLSLMQRDPGSVLTPELAREVAIRDGIKATIEGEVGSAGTGYILVATIRASESSDALATFRRTAEGPGDVIAAIDGLSQDIREKTGESLRSIKTEEPLERVTTSSLDALRKYSEGERLTEAGQARRAKELLEEAVELDPTFAMAWRKLSVVIQTAGGEPGEAQATATRAYELRDRLTEVERGQATAYYHRQVTGDLPAMISAYEEILADYPDNRAALNNLSIAYQDRSRYEDALALLERAVNGPGESAASHVNRVAALAYLGRIEEAADALATMEERYPRRDVWHLWCSWYVAVLSGDAEAAHRMADEMRARPDAPPGWQLYGRTMQAVSDVVRGRVEEARAHLAEATESGRAAGAYEAVVATSLVASELERVVAEDPDAAVAVLRQVVDRGDFEALPAVARDWASLTAQAAVSRAEDVARGLLEAWGNEGGVVAGIALSEARQVVDAFNRPEPTSAANALEAFNSRVGCRGCADWVLAELYASAGASARAAELYEAAIARRSLSVDGFPWERVIGRERLGLLYDELGEAATAAGHYRVFAEAWANADPDLQPRVRHARERAAASGGGVP